MSSDACIQSLVFHTFPANAEVTETDLWVLFAVVKSYAYSHKKCVLILLHLLIPTTLLTRFTTSSFLLTEFQRHSYWLTHAVFRSMHVEITCFVWHAGVFVISWCSSVIIQTRHRTFAALQNNMVFQRYAPFCHEWWISLPCSSRRPVSGLGVIDQCA